MASTPCWTLRSVRAYRFCSSEMLLICSPKKDCCASPLKITPNATAARNRLSREGSVDNNPTQALSILYRLIYRHQGHRWISELARKLRPVEDEIPKWDGQPRQPNLISSCHLNRVFTRKRSIFPS